MADSSQTQNPAVFRSGRTGRNLSLVAERTIPSPTTPADSSLEAEKKYLTEATNRLIKWDAQLKVKEAELLAGIRIVKATMGIAAARVVTFLSMIVCAALFTWAVYDPAWMRTGAAICFAVLVFLPALWADAAKSSNAQQQS